MGNRLDTERQADLEPKRIEYAKQKIHDVGCPIITVDSTKIVFQFKGENCTIYPYSGWHTGKSIKDGRGLQNLLSQLKED